MAPCLVAQVVVKRRDINDRLVLIFLGDISAEPAVEMATQ